MYFSPYMNPSEIGDFDVVEHDGQLHAFYLELPSHDSIGHLVSDDGINWQPLPPAIRTGAPDEFDGDQIWTMGVFRRGDQWFMLYTANVNRSLNQVTALATSSDLIHWVKYKNNPVIEPDGRWYEATQHGAYRIDWRDPHVIEHDGKLHGFICARQNQGTLNRRGCAGYFTSTDGYHWQVQPPASTPGNCFDYECPSVFKLRDRFYMVAIHGAHNRSTYRIADHVQGPYRRPLDDSITPWRNMSLRPCHWRGETYLFHWQRDLPDWPNPLSPRPYSIICSPKRAVTDDAGNLYVQSFDWTAFHDGQTQLITPQTPANITANRWQWQSQTLTGQSDIGSALWLTKQQYHDFEMVAELTLDQSQGACEFGLALRTDDDGDTGIFAHVVPGRYACELVRLDHVRPRGPQSLARGRTVMQSYHFTPPVDQRYTLRCIAHGPNIEINLNGRLVLARLTLPRRAGKVGVFIEDGRAAFNRITITPLTPPTVQWCW